MKRTAKQGFTHSACTTVEISGQVYMTGQTEMHGCHWPTVEDC